MARPMPPHLSPEAPSRKIRKESQYTQEERTVLGKYRAEYKATTTHSQRDTLVRGKIFPDMFNFWYQKEQRLPNETETEERKKNLCHWIRNNWRPDKSVAAAASTRKRSVIEIVWQRRHLEVEAEMAALYKREGGTGEPPVGDLFRLRTTAAKNIYMRLDNEEKQKIDQERNNPNSYVNPPEVQQKRAKKYAARDAERWAEYQWRDKGLLVVVFYAFRGPDNVIDVNACDQMAANAGVPLRHFIDTHGDLVDDMEVKLVNYAKKLLCETDPPSGPGDGQQVKTTPTTTNAAVEARLEHLAMQDGFPVMPEVRMGDRVKKQDLEKLMRAYLTAHYKLASGQTKKHVPFGLLTKSPTEFVEWKYCPRRFAFKDPRNMTKGDIYAFCQHVRKRQEENGTTDAFRFVKYHNGKEMVNADYGTRSGEQRTAARPSEARQGGQLGKKKKGADKGKQRQQSSQSDEEETDTAPVQRGATPSNISQDADIVDRIDPALLAMNQTGTQQGQQGQATVANNRLGSALENPAVTTDAAGQHAAAGPNTIVTQRQMEVLTTNGHEAVLPLNGPNEGLPLYQVHSIATELFSGAAPHSLKKGIAIEPGLRPKLRTTKKRVRNADKQTIEEAKKLGIRPAGTRANARTRRG